MKKGVLFIVSAPSGAGKTSLTRYVIKALNPPFNISKIITYTTRKPRSDEISGVDYNFISLDEFEQKKATGQFLETTKYNDNFYGSPHSIITDLANGKSFLLVVDRVGAKNLRTLVDKPVLIWLTVPNIQILKERIINRGTESNQILNERLVLADKEIKDEKCDPTFQYHIINNNFMQAAEEIIAIIKKELI